MYEALRHDSAANTSIFVANIAGWCVHVQVLTAWLCTVHRAHTHARWRA
jgi:hypothetical protein